jgi:hypothetical protein
LLVDVVVTNVDADLQLENACEDRDLFFGRTLLFAIERDIVFKLARRRHHVNKVQRRGAHARGEDRDLFQLVHEIAPHDDLDRKRQLRHVATRKSANQAIERAGAAPVIVCLTIYAVETERNVRHCFSIRVQRLPRAFEVPTVGNKAGLQTAVADRFEYLGKLGMKCRLATGEVDARDLRGSARFVDYAAQQFERKELRVIAVEIVFGTKAVAAMEIADVGQFHTQTMWTIVVIEVAGSLHWFQVRQALPIIWEARSGSSRSVPAMRLKPFAWRARRESSLRFGPAIAVS